MAVLPQILQPEIINARISRLNLINTTLQTAFGCQRGGPNVRPSAGRRGSYDVFNDTREVATARLPGTPAGVIARQVVGTVPFQIPRAAEKMPLLIEELDNLRRIGGPAGEIDAVGELYISDQERIVAQRMTNLREFQIAAMLRGTYTYTVSGDDLIHGFSGGSITIDYQIPSGNKSQLNMLAGGDIISTTWSNVAATIVTDLFDINAAFIQLIGRGLTDVWVTSVVWNHITGNTQVQDQAGTVNQPWEFITRDEERQEFTARLRAIPWVTFHITDNGLNLNGTFTKLIQDTAAVFTTRMDSQIVQMYEYYEPITRWDGDPAQKYGGEYYWACPKMDPAMYYLHGVFNGLPVLLNPKAIAYGTVVF